MRRAAPELAIFGQHHCCSTPAPLDPHERPAWEQVYPHTPASFDGVLYRFRDACLEPEWRRRPSSAQAARIDAGIWRAHMTDASAVPGRGNVYAAACGPG